MTTTATDLQTRAEEASEDLKIAKRHASQLAALSPERRKEVRATIDKLLGEEKETPKS